MGADLYDRVAKFVEHFGGVGKALDQAVNAYDKAVGTLERRVLVSARKFRELGATAQAEIVEVTPVERVPRTFQADLLTPSSADYDEN